MVIYPTWISKSRESKVIQNSPWFPPKSEVRTLKYVEFQSNDILTVPKVIYFNKFLYKKRQLIPVVPALESFLKFNMKGLEYNGLEIY